MTTPTRPLLRYHGGKWRIAPWIISHFPPHISYVEPFGGAASVLLQKSRIKTEVWNDLNSELVLLFSLLRDPQKAKQLIEVCSLTPFAREEFQLSYDKTGDPLEDSRRFIIRSFFGFGSKSCISLSKNGFRSFRHTENSPAIDWSTYPEALRTIVTRMRGVVVENQDALAVIRRYDRPDTLFYCDPPYVHSERNLVHGSYSHELSDTAHEELAETLKGIKGMVLISGYPSALYARLFKGWRVVTRTSYADMCSPRTECLWISPNAAKKMRQGNLLEYCSIDNMGRCNNAVV